MAKISLAFDRALASIGTPRDVVTFDRLTMRHFDVDGRLHVAKCNISKANVCPYFGREIIAGATGANPNDFEPNRIYYLFRDPGELAKAAPTFRNLQLLMYHAATNAADPKIAVTVGTLGSDVEFNAPYLQDSLAVWTAEAIKLIESKQQAQLSASYRYRVDMTPGQTSDGIAYDGVMRDIIGNHVALVDEGRAGPDVYVSDSLNLELAKMVKRRNHKVLVAAALRALNLTSTATAEQRLALDAAMEEEEKKAAEDEAAEEEEERKKKAAEDAAAEEEEERKKKALAAKDKGARDNEPSEPKREGAAMDARAVADVVDAAFLTRDYVSRKDAERMANDAAVNAVKHMQALNKACEDVKPLVGVVGAMDSAADVYAFALKQARVDITGVPAEAYPALVREVLAKKAALAHSAPRRNHVALAADAANDVASAIPGLSRIQIQ